MWKSMLMGPCNNEIRMWLRLELDFRGRSTSPGETPYIVDKTSSYIFLNIFSLWHDSILKVLFMLQIIMDWVAEILCHLTFQRLVFSLKHFPNTSDSYGWPLLAEYRIFFFGLTVRGDFMRNKHIFQVTLRLLKSRLAFQVQKYFSSIIPYTAYITQVWSSLKYWSQICTEAPL